MLCYVIPPLEVVVLRRLPLVDLLFSPAMTTNMSTLVLRVELLERHLDSEQSAFGAQHIHGASDTFWLLFCGALVNFMQVGFAMLETGSVRQKNSMNILIKNLLDVCSGALAWFAFGSSIARDGEGAVFGGASRSLFNVIEAEDGEGDADADGYLLASWSFQFVFAATATTIVSGAMAERTQILAFLCSSFVASQHGQSARLGGAPARPL